MYSQRPRAATGSAYPSTTAAGGTLVSSAVEMARRWTTPDGDPCPHGFPGAPMGFEIPPSGMQRWRFEDKFAGGWADWLRLQVLESGGFADDYNRSFVRRACDGLVPGLT